jgi:ATP-dependent Clp protease adapter protein ClpS
MSTFSGNLEHSIQRALAAANQRQHEYATLEHLLLALTDDEDASTVMRACNVDLEKLRRDLIVSIESEPENPATDGSKDAKPTGNFQRVIQRAVTHGESVGREKVTGAEVLVAILAEHESRAADFLQRQGATRYELTRYISHGIGSDRDALDRKGRDGPTQHTASDTPAGLTAQVLLLNDDYTPMEFVVHVLEHVFDKDHEAAIRIMLEIHNNGSGTCGVYPHDVADAKVREVLDFAREHQHPLQCVLQ